MAAFAPPPFSSRYRIILRLPSTPALNFQALIIVSPAPCSWHCPGEVATARAPSDSMTLQACIHYSTSFTPFATSSIPASRFFPMKLKTQRTIAHPSSPQPLPVPTVTAVLISQTAYSRCVLGGVISMTTMAESSAPPVAAPPAALNAAAPATPPLVASGMVNVQCKKKPPKTCASSSRVAKVVVFDVGRSAAVATVVAARLIAEQSWSIH